jgi:acetaldehyde dehydrogenase (acetylating)
MVDRALTACLVVALMSIAGAASADEKGPTVTVKTTTVKTTRAVRVVGRAARPSVIIEIARARPAVKLEDLSDPAVELVRAAVKAPF